MKLRNKKTGEIFYPDDWEAFEPAEPLIKDEKVRKLVRAFSDVIQENEHILVIKQSYKSGTAEFSNGSCFWMRIPFSSGAMDAIEDRTYYALTELCGEADK